MGVFGPGSGLGFRGSGLGSGAVVSRGPPLDGSRITGSRLCEDHTSFFRGATRRHFTSAVWSTGFSPKRGFPCAPIFLIGAFGSTCLLHLFRNMIAWHANFFGAVGNLSCLLFAVLRYSVVVTCSCTRHFAAPVVYVNIDVSIYQYVCTSTETHRPDRG